MKERDSRFLLMFVGAGTIFTAFVSILVSWHSLTLINKVTAILFLTLLVISPFREISHFRSGRNPMGLYGGLIVGYLITILALTSLVRR